MLHHDGLPIVRPPIRVPVRAGTVSQSLEIILGPAPGSKWAEGHYTAYLYGYEHKLAETAWNVEEG